MKKSVKACALPGERRAVRAPPYEGAARVLVLTILMVVFAVAADARADGAAGNDGKPSSPSAVSPLTVRTGSEVAVYQDTDYTTVVTPVVFAGVESPLGGWGVSGSLLVDAVSTASADIVATASTRWQEVRVAPALSGHKRLGDVDVALRASGSTEPDYLSLAGGVSVSADLARKMVTPALTYDFAHDTLGRAGTPFSVWSRPIQRHTASLGVAFVLDQATVFVPSVTGVFEIGDTSKPYRFIPMFDAAHVGLVQSGMGASQIDPIRLDFRPLEQLPTERQRWALDGRLAHRFANSTLRVDQRFYADTWGIKASSSDVRWFVDVTPRLRAGAHLRFHIQTAVSFWQLAYVATMTPQGPKVPALRTEARELGALYTPTEGLEFRFALDRRGRFALTLGADMGETKFIDQLFIDHRLSVLGTTLFETEIE